MLHLGVSWALGLWAHLSLIIFPTITLLYSTISHWLCSLYIFFVSFSTCSVLSFLYPKCWSSSFYYMEDGHIISIIYTMNIDLKTLSLKRSYHWREFRVFWRLRARSSIIDLNSLGLICLCWGYVHLYICKKRIKNKNKHMCVYA